MTTPQTFGVMASAFFFSSSYMADIYTTAVGLQNGFKEGGFVTKNLMKLKWLNLQLGQVLIGGGVLWLGAFFTNYGAGPASAFFSIVGAGEAVQAYENYQKLKAAKISLK